MKRTLKTFLGLAAVAALLALAACENVTSAKDDPNINVAPERPSVTPGNRKLNVRWTAVAGATNYKVYVATGSEEADRAEWTDDPLVLDGTRLIQITLTGLVNGTEYYIWAQAVYSHGDSPLSEAAQGKPVEPPDRPRGLTVTAGDTMLQASWNAPYASFGGDVGSYELAVTSNPNLENGFVFDPENADDEETQRSDYIARTAEKLVEAGADARSALITGLTNGTTYYVRLRAKNTAGGSAFDGPQSAAPAWPGEPSAPTSLTVTGGNKKLSLSWPAATNASRYAVYKNTADDPSTAVLVRDGIPAKLGNNTAVVQGLDNGATYYVWVVAQNSERLYGATDTSAVSGNGVPAPKSPPDYNTNSTVLGSMTARFVNEEFGKGDRLARKQETPLGDLTGDGLVWWAREHAAEYGITGNVDFAFYNGGLITGGHDAGNVTVASLRQVFYGAGGDPFSYITLNGAEVKRLFDYAATVRHDGGGGSGTGAFGQVSAEVTYTINYSYGADPRYGVIENLKVHGVPVDPNREYRIITSTYLIEGGDGYGAYLYSNRRRDTGVYAWRMVAEYIWDQDLPLEPVTDGRLTLIGAVWTGAH